MKVPVRPTPALQCTSSGMPSSLLWAFCTLLMKEMREVANLGTPWSGQEVKWYWITGRGFSSGRAVCRACTEVQVVMEMHTVWRRLMP